MRVLHLTPLAKARIWFRRTIPVFVPAGTIREQVIANSMASVRAGYVTLEAFVPRGGRAEYGLLGISFERDCSEVLRVEVPYSEGEDLPWLDSLGKQMDDVRLGLPNEYTGSILAAAIEVGAHQFPPGTIKVTNAAHGLVGSSALFFQRLTTGALTLMLDGDQREDDDMIRVLNGLLVG